MSEPVSRLPARPSLEHLRKQAKDLHHSAAAGDAAAVATIRRHKAGNANPSLAEAQHALAREYGFANWPALANHVSAVNPEDPRTTPHGLSTRPPFYQIDWTANRIEPRQPLTDADWDVLIGVIREHGLTGVNARGQMTDAVLGRLADIDHLTDFEFDGTGQVTDDGLRHLARMPQLESLDLSDRPDGRITDRGLECLRHLPALKRFKICWQAGITDAGVAHLADSGRLEEVNLLGTRTGDGALDALRAKPALAWLRTGRLVTDAGLRHLLEFPVFRTWAGGAPSYGLMTFGDSGPNHLLLDGPFTDRGLATLGALEGLFGLSFFWHTTGITSGGLAALARLPHLGAVGCQDALCDDVAMAHIAAIPGLRALMAQGAIAGDDGFSALARSATLEYLWGRDCTNLGDRGFQALASAPALRGLAVSCRGVSDEALQALPSFPALIELVPMDVTDEGFRHVGRSASLERLVCMYCRETGDRATELIRGLSRLAHYYAGQTRITDRSLEILGGIDSLEEVALSACQGITDGGLAHLARLPLLRRLAVDQTATVTRAGIRVFPSSVHVTLSRPVQGE